MAFEVVFDSAESFEEVQSSGGGTDFEKDLDNDLDSDADDEGDKKGKIQSAFDMDFEDQTIPAELLKNPNMLLGEDEEDSTNLDEIDNILELSDTQFPKFTLAKNKARFLRMVSWYRNKEEWIEVAPLSGVTKLFKQQTKELEGIRSSKLDYEMELETGTLTPSQRSYRKDELKMCKVQEKMAVHLISKLQLKIKSGRR
ncbi:MAG: hypothetical protein L6Q37_02270 [Bdellovibrionaceae bacterium]|nr:hypothetical protein [Pseudobdellovibrionaceae bacterium]